METTSLTGNTRSRFVDYTNVLRRVDKNHFYIAGGVCAAVILLIIIISAVSGSIQEPYFQLKDDDYGHIMSFDVKNGKYHYSTPEVTELLVSGVLHTLQASDPNSMCFKSEDMDAELAQKLVDMVTIPKDAEKTGKKTLMATQCTVYAHGDYVWCVNNKGFIIESCYNDSCSKFFDHRKLKKNDDRFNVDKLCENGFHDQN
ncbi:hypothetical protein P9112_012653 [Eukaryota sp. TZLM1-RC]